MGPPGSRYKEAQFRMKKKDTSTSKKAKAAHEPTKIKPHRWKRRLLVKVGLVLLVVVALWVVYLDALVRDKFEGKKWSLPAQVFARPLEIYEGRGINPELLEYELKLLNYQVTKVPERQGTYSRQDSQFLIQTRGYDFPDAPQKSLALQFSVTQDRVTALTINGQQDVSALVRLEPYLIGGIYPAQKEDRLLVRLDQVPPSLVSMLLATEDRNFYTHFGIAPLSILRALVANLQAGKAVQGGSTLTQQLVKNFYLTQERSIQRKATEAVMSLLLDAHYEKDEILETYLNEVYLGQAGQREIHGFGMASQFYFAQPLASLELHQSALLVAMVKGASWYNPRRFPERALKRRNFVLDLLAKDGVVSDQAAQAAKAKDLGVTPTPSFSINRFPAFFELVQRQLAQEYQTKDLQTDGLRIFTTLDPQIQHAAEDSLIATLNASKKSKAADLQGSVVVTMAESGDVVALVGGKDPRFDGFNRALDAVRPIGSLIKPVIFLEALRHPEKYALASLLDDEAFFLTFENGETWRPQNYDKKSHGKVPLHAALARSLNLATARLGIELGVPNIIELLHDLGLEKEISPYPSMLLGATNHSPMDMARLYQVFAAGGFRVPLHAVRLVSTHEGAALSRYPFEVRQMVESTSIYLINKALVEVMQEGTGKGVQRWLPESLVVAGKTGTTNDGRDSWFAGFSGDYLGVVWIGKDDNSATGLTGSSGALPVWGRMMGMLPQRPYEATEPPGITQIRVGVADADGELNCEHPRVLPAIEPLASGLPLCDQQRSGSWLQRLFN